MSWPKFFCRCLALIIKGLLKGAVSILLPVEFFSMAHAQQSLRCTHSREIEVQIRTDIQTGTQTRSQTGTQSIKATVRDGFWMGQKPLDCISLKNGNLECKGPWAFQVKDMTFEMARVDYDHSKKVAQLSSNTLKKMVDIPCTE